MRLLPFLSLVTPILGLDGMFHTNDDPFERKMSVMDIILNPSPARPPARKLADLQIERDLKRHALFQKLERQVKLLRSRMHYEDIHSIRSRFLWQKIYEYIMNNLEKHLKGLEFSVSVTMTYSFCFFIVPLRPTNYFMVIPNFLRLLFPRKVRRIPIVEQFLSLFESFMKRIKTRIDEDFIATIVISKTLTSSEDLKVIKDIPNMLEQDPLMLVKWLMGFNLRIVGEPKRGK